LFQTVRFLMCFQNEFIMLFELVYRLNAHAYDEYQDNVYVHV